MLVAADGTTFTPLVKRELPEKGVPNSNWAYTLDAKLNAPATALKVRVTSGYKTDHWGLGEVEVFGTGAMMRPDDDNYHVNTDITDLKPGATYHYRLVAVSSAGTTHGADRIFTTPATKQPLAETGSATRITATYRNSTFGSFTLDVQPLHRDLVGRERDRVAALLVGRVLRGGEHFLRVQRVAQQLAFNPNCAPSGGLRDSVFHTNPKRKRGYLNVRPSLALRVGMTRCAIRVNDHCRAGQRLARLLFDHAAQSGCEPCFA